MDKIKEDRLHSKTSRVISSTGYLCKWFRVSKTVLINQYLRKRLITIFLNSSNISAIFDNIRAKLLTITPSISNFKAFCRLSSPAIIGFLPIIYKSKILIAKCKIREGLPLCGNQVNAALRQVHNLDFILKRLVSSY